MARESFEDPDIAELLNAHFVPVKVDREERPDVDRVYMAYIQAVTGQGGWPLSAWLTPDLRPFYGGTYFPPKDLPGRPGFPSVLRAIARGWREDRARMVDEAERLLSELKAAAKGGEAPAAGDLPAAANAAFSAGFQFYESAFDSSRGGFGGAPKFPRAGNLGFLLRCAALQGPASEEGEAAARMAADTLRAMARGGIHDAVGGGFHRYAVDEDWFVPHFEKMLYDQAQIALNAAEVWQATSDERHAWLVRDILEYALRDLADPAGGFYSAEDADSELPGGGGEAEGAFYLWTEGELRSELGADADLFCGHFGVRPSGNVPAARDPHGEFTGKNILAQARTLADSAKAAGLTLQEASDRIASALERLRAVRARRPRPALDDKVITAWNGLAISALARASSIPAESLADRRDAYRSAATAAADFVRRELWDKPGASSSGRGARAGAASRASPRTTPSSSRAFSTSTRPGSTSAGSSGPSGCRPGWTSSSGTARRGGISIPLPAPRTSSCGSRRTTTGPSRLRARSRRSISCGCRPPWETTAMPTGPGGPWRRSGPAGAGCPRRFPRCSAPSSPRFCPRGTSSWPGIRPAPTFGRSPTSSSTGFRPAFRCSSSTAGRARPGSPGGPPGWRT